ncbi:MAG: hypothetical protein ACYCY3_09110, partial [Halothiobacillus sp.]
PELEHEIRAALVKTGLESLSPVQNLFFSHLEAQNSVTEIADELYELADKIFRRAWSDSMRWLPRGTQISRHTLKRLRIDSYWDAKDKFLHKLIEQHTKRLSAEISRRLPPRPIIMNLAAVQNGHTRQEVKERASRAARRCTIDHEYFDRVRRALNCYLSKFNGNGVRGRLTDERWWFKKLSKAQGAYIEATWLGLDPSATHLSRNGGVSQDAISARKDA